MSALFLTNMLSWIFYSASSKKLVHSGRHVILLIILIPSQLVFALILQCCMLIWKAANTNFSLVWTQYLPHLSMPTFTPPMWLNTNWALPEIRFHTYWCFTPLAFIFFTCTTLFIVTHCTPRNIQPFPKMKLLGQIEKKLFRNVPLADLVRIFMLIWSSTWPPEPMMSFYWQRFLSYIHLFKIYLFCVKQKQKSDWTLFL